MDHISKVSSFYMDQGSIPLLDVTRPDPQFGMNEEYGACRVRIQILNQLVATFDMIASECCIFDL